jgi:hypothetical protein
MLDIIRTNDYRTFLVQFPQFEALYKTVEVSFRGLCDTMQRVVDSLPPFEDRKEFGTAVSKIKWKTLIFEMFNLKIPNVKTYLSSVTYTKLIEILKYLQQQKLNHDFQ